MSNYWFGRGFFRVGNSDILTMWWKLTNMSNKIFARIRVLIQSHLSFSRLKWFVKSFHVSKLFIFDYDVRELFATPFWHVLSNRWMRTYSHQFCSRVCHVCFALVYTREVLRDENIQAYCVISRKGKMHKTSMGPSLFFIRRLVENTHKNNSSANFWTFHTFRTNFYTFRRIPDDYCTILLS